MHRDKQMILSAKTDNELWNLWTKAIVGDKDITSCTKREVKDYLRISDEDLDKYWGEKGTQKIKKDWQETNTKAPQEIEKFYENEVAYIPKLASWHCIKKNDTILQIVRSLQFAVRHNCHKYLDFGCGIGSSGLLFHYYGFEVELVDISTPLLDFAKFRFHLRGIKSRVISTDLKKTKIQKQNYYEFASAVEVLEHISDPAEIMKVIHQLLIKRGFIFITTPFFPDKERPQHIVTSFSVIPDMLKVGFREISVSDDGINRIWQKI